MQRPSSLGSPLRLLALVLGPVFGLGTVGQAFTLIPFNTVEKASEGFPSGADAPSDSANKPRYTVSDDGCFVVFTSQARNLTATQNDGNGRTDVFLYESCGTYKVTLVSHVGGSTPDPNKAANGRSDQPVISPDGRFVVFRSTADDIVPERVPDFSYTGQTNVFIWDIGSDSFLLASHKNSDDQEPGDRDSQNGVISRGTGQRYVAFESLANNLNDSQATDISQIYRYELFSGGTPVDLVSAPNTGLPDIEANGHSYNPAISGPGLCIVYESEATNLVSDKLTDDVNGALRDVFRWQDPRATILLSHRAGAPAETGDGESTEASIDDVCERFAFKSEAKDLVAGQNDGNGGSDVFHAGNNGDAELVSHIVGDPRTTGSDPSGSPILSRDGKWVAYASRANDLSPGQAEPRGSSDVFVYDRLGDKNTLASHTATDPKTPGSGESFAPEISINGFYVAYESDAKDLDLNQNDGNGARDVFLYNTRWNNSIVASMRYASIAITGNGRSYRPALSGQGYAVAFTGGSSDHIADDPDTPSAVDDVFLFKASPFIPFLSVRSTTDRHVLQWVLPPVDYVSMRTFVRPGTGCASDTFPPAGTEVFFVSPPANTTYQSPADGPYASGTTLCYSIYVQDDAAAAINPGDSPMRTIVARTLDDLSGTAKWASNVAGLTALSQVGIGTQNLIAVANDGGVYGLTRGASGGLWPGAYRPFRTDFSPIQGRPPVVGLSVLGSTNTTFVGSQDGRAYAFDANRGAGPGAGGALWYTTPKLGDVVQPGASGMFTLFGGLANHILIGARTGTAGTFFALDASNGSVRGAYTGSAPLGAISGAASVDYGANRVYFTSLEGFDDPSLWCLTLTATGFGTDCWAPRTDPAGISGGPVQRTGKVYVGDDLNGELWAFDSATGNPAWPGPYSACGGGASVKGFVLADRGGTGQDLYYSTALAVCAVTDLGASPMTKWIRTTIPNPSTPILARILGVAYVFVGGSDGRLYQIEADNPTAVTSVLLRTGPPSTIGPPAFDVFDNMIYVGSEEGVIYAVQAPLP